MDNNDYTIKDIMSFREKFLEHEIGYTRRLNEYEFLSFLKKIGFSMMKDYLIIEKLKPTLLDMSFIHFQFKGKYKSKRESLTGEFNIYMEDYSFQCMEIDTLDYERINDKWINFLYKRFVWPYWDKIRTQ